MWLRGLAWTITIAVASIPIAAHALDVVLEGKLVTRTLDVRGTITIGDGVVLLDHSSLWHARSYTVRIGSITAVQVKAGMSRGTLTLDCGGTDCPIVIRTTRGNAREAGKQLRDIVVHRTDAAAVPSR